MNEQVYVCCVKKTIQLDISAITIINEKYEKKTPKGRGTEREQNIRIEKRTEKGTQARKAKCNSMSPYAR